MISKVSWYLKGANASALYGSDAANGAILITTKKAGQPFRTGQFPILQTYNSPSFPNILFIRYIYGSGHINQFREQQSQYICQR